MLFALLFWGPYPLPHCFVDMVWLLLYALTKLSYIQISSPVFDSIPAVDVCTPLLVFDFDTLSFFQNCRQRCL